jgi:hypothetical protein
MNNKQVCSSLLVLLSLSACSISGAWESITGDRPSQPLNGARRTPELNVENRLAPITPTTPPASAMQTYNAPTASPVLPTTAPQAATVNPTLDPYDNYDPNGNFTTYKPADKSPVVEQETPKTGNFFTRLIGLDSEPQKYDAPIDSTTRKPFAGNAYFQLNPAATSAETQKLSSVPETPTKFQDVKSSFQQNLSDLKSDQSAAVQAKADLNSEVATGAAPTVIAPTVIAPAISAPLATKSLPTVQADTAPKETIKPVSAPQSSYFAIPKSIVQSEPVPVTSLPEIKVDAPSESSAPPIQPQYTTAPTAQEINAPTSDAQSPAPVALPSPEIIKTMRPSRYESRRHQ